MTTNYNLDKIRAALLKQKTSTNKEAKIKYYKPQIGTHDIRFLPYQSSDGHPVQEVHYYEKISPDGKRIVAPYFFGLPDPIRDIYNERRKEKNGWVIAKHLKPRKRFYAVLIDRNAEVEGPQVWEFGEDIRDAIYTKMLSKDYIDENLFDPINGYDFELTVSQAVDDSGKPKSFNGFPVKKMRLEIRRKPSPLHKDKEIRTRWINEMPNLEEIFKKQASKEPEYYIELLENFITKLEEEAEKVSSKKQTESSSSVNSKKPTEETSNSFKKKTSVDITAEEEEDNNEVLDKAFDDI
jgi:hypothetical protein